MKYIRTKDIEDIDNQKILEVYEITKGTTFEGLIYQCYTLHNDFTESIVFDCDVINQADTIEELCDEFTYEYDKNLKHVRCWKDTYTGKWYDCDTDVLLNEKEKSTIKGAIWTNKGLIYVAKMNNEGELELI